MTKRIERDQLIEMHKRMLIIRHFEQKAWDLASQGKIPGMLHVSIGQEAVSVGVCSALLPDDYILSSHRAHGDLIAKGVHPRKVMAELMGKETGCCRGRGGSVHVTDASAGVLAVSGIVGGQIPIAAGAALASKLQGTDRVTICFFGDGALGQGVLFETVNMASLWSLPIVFVCVNNQYAISSRIDKVQHVTSAATWAEPYRIGGDKVDGNDVVEVYQAAQIAVDRARRGDGPSILDCVTYRWTTHGVGDPGLYRNTEEVEMWKKRGPIKGFQKYLLQKGFLTENEAERLDAEARALVEDAARYAETSPSPAPEQACKYLYAGPLEEVYWRCVS